MLDQSWRKENLVILLVLVLGISAFFHPMILSRFALVQTDPGDTRFNNYILEHSYQWILGNPLHKSFWDCPIFYPCTNATAFSDMLLGSAPIYWFWRILSFLPDTSFQLWMIAVGILNFLASFIFLRRGLGLSLIASAGGAYLFSFASMRGTQLNYPQLLPQFFTMIALFCICRMFAHLPEQEIYSNRRQWFWTAVFAAAVACQALAGIYLGFFLFLGLMIALAVSLVFRETEEITSSVCTAQLASFSGFRTCRYARVRVDGISLQFSQNSRRDPSMVGGGPHDSYPEIVDRYGTVELCISMVPNLFGFCRHSQ